MRKIIATITMITIMVFMTLALVACGSGGGSGGGNSGGESGPRAIPNEERVLRELSTDGRSIIPRTQTIDSVEITREITDEENWRHEVFVIVNSKDNEVAYVKHAVLVYDRNEDREWVLTGISPENQNLWSTSPLVGVNASMVESATREALSWQTITIDGDEWFVDENTIENISMSSQNTQLANHRDVVIVDVVLGSEARTAQGQIELDFTFNDGWFLNNHIGHTPFTSEYRAIAIFELTNEQLLDELVRHDAAVLRELIWNQQSIPMARDEISNFTILDYETSNKGANRVYNFSFDLDKDLVMFAVDAAATYSFDSMSGWVFDDFVFTAEMSSIAGLEGTIWYGEFVNWISRMTINNRAHGFLTIEFTDVASDGAFRAVISSVDPTTFSQSTTGIINLDDLSIRFHFADWITEPSNSDRYIIDRSQESGSRGQIDFLNFTIESTTGGGGLQPLGIGSFNVSLTDEVAEQLPELDETYDDEENGDE